MIHAIIVTYRKCAVCVKLEDGQSSEPFQRLQDLRATKGQMRKSGLEALVYRASFMVLADSLDFLLSRTHFCGEVKPLITSARVLGRKTS